MQSLWGCLLYTSSLTASSTGTGELEERLFELAALDGGLFEFLENFRFLGQVEQVVKAVLFLTLAVERYHGECFLALLAGADVGAEAAVEAVENGNTNGEFHVGHTSHGSGSLAGRSVGRFLFGHSVRTDDRVRTNERAESTLDTVVRVPSGNIDSNAAFFKGSGALREGAVGPVTDKGGDGQLVTLLRRNRDDDVVNEVNYILAVSGSFDCQIGDVYKRQSWFW